MTDCLNENDLLARVSGKLPPERVADIDAHVDGCAECRMLLAEAAHWLEEPRERAPSSTTFGAGDVVASRYSIVKLLGTGGMGEVYEANDRMLGEDIALKTLVPVIADDERALARLHSEVRMARRVTHVNVCRVYDFGVHERGEERIAFLTMELVRGTSLRRHLQNVGRLELSAALPLVAQMIAALSHAHAAGIVHRDFKSDNVLLVSGDDGAEPRVVVTDFGLARQSLVRDGQMLTPESRTVLGTLDYMSPEQVMGKPATPASDIYALGIVLYEMLTGQLPFQGDSPLARAVQRCTQPAPRLDAALPRAGVSATACIARCLETDPERRFSNVDEVLVALRAKAAAAPRPREKRLAVALVAATFVAMGAGYLAKRAERPAAHLPPRDPPTVVRSTGSPAASIPGSVTKAVDVSAVAPSVGSAATSAPPSPVSVRRQDPVRRRPPPAAPSVASAAPVPSAPVPSVVEAAPTGNALIDPFSPRF